VRELFTNDKLRSETSLLSLLLLSITGLVWGLKISNQSGLFLLSLISLFILGIFSYRQFGYKEISLIISITIILILGFISNQGSYNTSFGEYKLWGMALAGLIGLSILLQPKENQPLLNSLLMFSSITAGIVIFLAYLGQNYSAEFERLNGIGQLIARVIPIQRINYQIDDVLGGICVVTLPVFYNELHQQYRGGNKLRFIALVLGASFILYTMMLTASRSLWIGVFISIVAFAIGYFNRKMINKSLIVVLIISSMLLVITLIWLAVPGSKVAAIMSGIDYRIELISNSSWLIPDYWFLGGGPGTFPGLFSRYILNETHFYIAHSHNIFTNISIELGIISLTVITYLLLTPLVILIMNRKNIKLTSDSIVNVAMFSTYIFILLLDDPFWGGGSIPFLFVPLAFLLRDLSNPEREKLFKSIQTSLGILAIIIIFSFSLFARNVSITEYYANQQFADLELQGFPNDVSGYYDPLNEPDRLIQTYLDIAQTNPSSSAEYRLGIHFLRERQFEEAEKFLKSAYELHPNHSGYRENFAFNLVWLGDLEEAKSIGMETPKFVDKLSAFANWWKLIGENELSERAQKIINLMEQ